MVQCLNWRGLALANKFQTQIIFPQFLEFGSWDLVLGTWFLVLGSWNFMSLFR